MLCVENVYFSIPEDSPTVVANRVEEALQSVERKNDVVLRMVFRVTTSAALFREGKLQEMRDAVEPFRARARYSCVENVVVVPNAVARAATRAALLFFKPNVHTRVVRKFE